VTFSDFRSYIDNPECLADKPCNRQPRSRDAGQRLSATSARACDTVEVFWRRRSFGSVEETDGQTTMSSKVAMTNSSNARSRTNQLLCGLIDPSHVTTEYIACSIYYGVSDQRGRLAGGSATS